MHDFMTATTAELQEELLKRAITRHDQRIHELESQLAGIRLKQQARFRELKITGERARSERAEIVARFNAMATES